MPTGALGPGGRAAEVVQDEVCIGDLRTTLLAALASAIAPDTQSVCSLLPAVLGSVSDEHR